MIPNIIRNIINPIRNEYTTGPGKKGGAIVVTRNTPKDTGRCTSRAENI
jgi:hypothetical protein